VINDDTTHGADRNARGNRRSMNHPHPISRLPQNPCSGVSVGGGVGNDP
jgi:hypothetical protein